MLRRLVVPDPIMIRSRALVVLVVAGACGRIGFDMIPDGESCVGLASTCGPTATASCCESVLVPGGTFYRGYDVAPDMKHAAMDHPATVSDFRLDTYEVTVGRFRRFVDAHQGIRSAPPAVGAGANPHLSASGWDAGWNANLAADTPALVTALACDSVFQTW